MAATDPWLIAKNFNPDAFMKGAFFGLFIAPWKADRAAMDDLASVGIVEVSSYDFEMTSKDIEPPGEIWPVDSIVTGRKAEISGNFWEDNMDNIRLALGLAAESVTTPVPHAHDTTDGETGMVLGTDGDDVEQMYTACVVQLNQNLQLETDGDIYTCSVLELWKATFKSKTKLGFKRDGNVLIPFTLSAKKDYTIPDEDVATFGRVGRFRHIRPKALE